MDSFPFLRRETCYIRGSLFFTLMILKFTSCLQLLMTFFLVLTLVPLWKPTEYSYAYQKLSIGMAWPLLLKLKQNGVSGNLLGLIESLLSDRVQRVTLKVKNSDWERTRVGVPQESILGLLVFLIFINDLTTDIISNVKLFVDDVSLFSIVSDPL